LIVFQFRDLQGELVRATVHQLHQRDAPAALQLAHLQAGGAGLRLQFLSNAALTSSVFDLHLQLYKNEKIPFKHIEFIDNQPVLDMIEAKGKVR
jgi:hypothetical protein